MEMTKGKDKEFLYHDLRPRLFKPHYLREEQLDEIFSDDDHKKGIILHMMDLGICGKSTLAYSKKHGSTSEWSRHLNDWLDRIPLLIKIQHPLLIIGESGTGKEDMAKLLHYIGKGKDKPFVPVNCSAIPADILESELFGHAKGAFTNAIKAKPGLIETARGGSFFLDELAKMEHHLQYKLLRVIQERKIRRLGSNKDIEVEDVQVIIAVQPADIEHIVKDLQNRLNIYNAITLPPLSERLHGDPYLIYGVLEKLQKDKRTPQEKKEIERLQRKALEFEESFSRNSLPALKEETLEVTSKNNNLFIQYQNTMFQIEELASPVILSNEALYNLINYQGYTEKNFRELENILEYALIQTQLAGRKEILIRDLPESVRDSQSTQLKQVDIRSLPLKDIFIHADNIKRSAIREKIRDIYGKGKDIKSVLRDERVEGEYDGFMKKLQRTLGKGFLKELKRSP
jgi:transcriptional regulator with PAS, ATPase and Fis domain